MPQPCGFFRVCVKQPPRESMPKGVRQSSTTWDKSLPGRWFQTAGSLVSWNPTYPRWGSTSDLGTYTVLPWPGLKPKNWESLLIGSMNLFKISYPRHSMKEYHKCTRFFGSFTGVLLRIWKFVCMMMNTLPGSSYSVKEQIFIHRAHRILNKWTFYQGNPI